MAMDRADVVLVYSHNARTHTLHAQTGHVNVLSSFGVPFGEVEGKLLLDTDSLRQQLEIVVKAQPRLQVVGWWVLRLSGLTAICSRRAGAVL